MSSITIDLPTDLGLLYYYPIQTGDTYALQISCFGAKEIAGQTSLHSKKREYTTAFTELKKDLEAKLPKQGQILPVDKNSFGQTWLLTAFIDSSLLLDSSRGDLLALKNSCYEQITGKKLSAAQINNTNTVIDSGEWYGGKLFEFWQSPASCQTELTDILKENPHVIIWLFPSDEFDYIYSCSTNRT